MRVNGDGLWWWIKDKKERRWECAAASGEGIAKGSWKTERGLVYWWLGVDSLMVNNWQLASSNYIVIAIGQSFICWWAVWHNYPTSNQPALKPVDEILRCQDAWWSGVEMQWLQHHQQQQQPVQWHSSKTRKAGMSIADDDCIAVVWSQMPTAHKRSLLLLNEVACHWLKHCRVLDYIVKVIFP